MATLLTEAIAREALREVISERRAGPWVLTEPLGRGGQGQAWRALRRAPALSLTRQVLSDDLQQWHVLGDRAVIKLMLPPVAAEWRMPAEAYPQVADALTQQFIIECDLLASVRSPFVPRIYERGRAKTAAGWPVPWAAIELIEGVSLGTQMERTGPLDALRWLELAHDILAALAAIHAQGLVHLDVKIDNVMLEPLGARLIDFGLAQRAGDVIGKGHVGTPGYFAPEQLDDVIEEADFAYEVDLFKAGVTLARAAGKTLHDLWGVAPHESRSAIRAGLQQLPNLADLSADQRSLLRPMLAFDPRERRPAVEMLREVRRLLPQGSRRAMGDGHADGARNLDEVAAPTARIALGRDASPGVADSPGRAVRIGATVVAQDDFGLRWRGVVLGHDPKRLGHVLVQQHSSRGLRHVRSYRFDAIEGLEALDDGGAKMKKEQRPTSLSTMDLRARRETIRTRLAAASGRAQRSALQRLLDRIDERLAQQER